MLPATMHENGPAIASRKVAPSQNCSGVCRAFFADEYCSVVPMECYSGLPFE
jgi:hypothetical protein